MAKKTIDVDQVMANIKSKLDELAAMTQEAYVAGRKGDHDRESEIGEGLYETNIKIQGLVNELKYSPVIQLLMELTDKGISPQGALDYWIESWC